MLTIKTSIFCSWFDSNQFLRNASFSISLTLITLQVASNHNIDNNGLAD